MTRLVEGILTDEGYEVRTAHNSDAAIAAFRARRPALVVLDIWLQGSRLDGLGILKALMSEEPHVPVIMISGNEQATEQFYAQRIGADDFMKKPFSRFEVFARVEKLLDGDAAPRRNLA
jgi:two-component system nitrogen regulation response regulator NtrX